MLDRTLRPCTSHNITSTVELDDRDLLLVFQSHMNPNNMLSCRTKYDAATVAHANRA